MTLYHWGSDFPWLENKIPPENSFANALVGAHQGSITNFYARYCLDPNRKKPMAFTESAAFYNKEMPGPSELVSSRPGGHKSSTQRHSFRCSNASNWFDEYKRESVAWNNLADLTRSRELLRLTSHLLAICDPSGGERSHFLTAEDTKRLLPYYISASYLPQIVPVVGTINVSLEVKTAKCLRHRDGREGRAFEFRGKLW